jgi:multicomponent Na+:H+ antiporter subunit D
VLGGVMTDIGLIGVARTYWTVFDGPFHAHAHAVGDVLLWLGIVSAVLAGAMALLQRQLKRLLAYSVVCHIGIMLAGIGLLDSGALAGAEVMFLAHALLTAGLFFVAGILHVDHGTIDELRLRGRGGRGVGLLWLAATLGLTGTPYLGLYIGHSLVDDSAHRLGRAWVPALLWLGSALASAALLRAGGRIFLGWGGDRDPLLGEPMDEEPITRDVRRPLLVAVSVAAVALGFAISLVPGLPQRAEYAAERFRDRDGYAARVLHGTPMHPPPSLPVRLGHTTTDTLLYGAGATLLAAALAGVGLHRRRDLPRLAQPPVAALKSLHSGVVGDYVTWVVVGTAVTGGVWALLLH